MLLRLTQDIARYGVTDIAALPMWKLTEDQGH
jgi:hypothetical protein